MHATESDGRTEALALLLLARGLRCCTTIRCCWLRGSCLAGSRRRHGLRGCGLGWCDSLLIMCTISLQQQQHAALCVSQISIAHRSQKGVTSIDLHTISQGCKMKVHRRLQWV